MTLSSPYVSATNFSHMSAMAYDNILSMMWCSLLALFGSGWHGSAVKGCLSQRNKNVADLALEQWWFGWWKTAHYSLFFTASWKTNKPIFVLTPCPPCIMFIFSRWFCTHTSCPCCNKPWTSRAPQIKMPSHKSSRHLTWLGYLYLHRREEQELQENEPPCGQLGLKNHMVCFGKWTVSPKPKLVTGFGENGSDNTLLTDKLLIKNFSLWTSPYRMFDSYFWEILTTLFFFLDHIPCVNLMTHVFNWTKSLPPAPQLFS